MNKLIPGALYSPKPRRYSRETQALKALCEARRQLARLDLVDLSRFGSCLLDDLTEHLRANKVLTESQAARLVTQALLAAFRAKNGQDS